MKRLRTLSGIVSGTSRNNDVENQDPTGDRFENDPHPEVEFSTSLPVGSAIQLTPTDSNLIEASHNNLSGKLKIIWKLLQLRNIQILGIK